MTRLLCDVNPAHLTKHTFSVIVDVAVVGRTFNA